MKYSDIEDFIKCYPPENRCILTKTIVEKAKRIEFCLNKAKKVVSKAKKVAC
jgi:hypothetical protein